MNPAALLFILGSVLSVCPGDPLCQQCDDSSKCIYCAYSYPDDNGTCVPTSAVPYCYSYQNATFCNECQDRTFQDIPNQRCTPLDPSIIKTCLHAFNSTTACDVCPNGILAVEGSCNTTTYCNDPNCFGCYWNADAQRQMCWLCGKGYVLWSATVEGTACFKPTNMTGCYSSTSVSKCLNCNIGYYIGPSGCVRSPALDYNVPGSSVGRPWASLLSIAAPLLLWVINSPF